MDAVIQNHRDRIAFTPEEIYFAIFKYIPSYNLMRDSGFPLTDPNSPNQIIIDSSRSFFRTSPDPAKQRCNRCKKPLSLLEQDWYLDEAGCSYHPGEREFCGGPEHGLYSCCKRMSGARGCSQHIYHISDFKSSVDERNFVKTTEMHQPGFETRNVFALDCEMVYTTVGMEVVRVSLVSIYGETAYDSLVLPANPVLDYCTAFSGVKAGDLEHVTTTLADAQNSLLMWLNSNSILIGHGLENDLLALSLSHRNIVDTSLVFEHPRGFPYRHSLSSLVSSYLKTPFRSDSNGHDSIEDAKASMALILYKVSMDNPGCHYGEQFPDNSIPESLSSTSYPTHQLGYKYVNRISRKPGSDTNGHKNCQRMTRDMRITAYDNYPRQQVGYIYDSVPNLPNGPLPNLQDGPLPNFPDGPLPNMMLCQGMTRDMRITAYDNYPRQQVGYIYDSLPNLQDGPLPNFPDGPLPNITLCQRMTRDMRITAYDNYPRQQVGYIYDSVPNFPDGPLPDMMLCQRMTCDMRMTAYDNYPRQQVGYICDPLPNRPNVMLCQRRTRFGKLLNYYVRIQ